MNSSVWSRKNLSVWKLNALTSWNIVENREILRTSTIINLVKQTVCYFGHMWVNKYLFSPSKVIGYIYLINILIEYLLASIYLTIKCLSRERWDIFDRSHLIPIFSIHGMVCSFILCPQASYNLSIKTLPNQDLNLGLSVWAISL